MDARVPRGGLKGSDCLHLRVFLFLPAQHDRYIVRAPPVKPKDFDSSDKLSLPWRADGLVPHAVDDSIWLFGD